MELGADKKDIKSLSLEELQAEIADNISRCIFYLDY